MSDCQIGNEQAWADLESYLTTKLLPQYAAEISEWMETKVARGLLLSASAQGFNDEQTKRLVENALILAGRVKW